jgi:hypothetical protein
MRDMVLKAVAQPPKIFWGPVLPVVLNMGIQFPIMFMSMGVWNINPLMFVFSILIVHGLVVFAGTRDPHLSAMIQAFGQTNLVSKNIYAEKGNKFEP